MYDIWSILGIEPTTNKKKIQQAYADKIKIYHPEDDPEGFQRLKEAYRSAIAYMKNQSVQGSTVQISERVLPDPILPLNPIVEKVEKKKEYTVEGEPDSGGEHEEGEAIPEYIAKLGSADANSLYGSDIKKYVLCLEQNLVDNNVRVNLKEIEELFEDMRFRLVINLDEFLVCFQEEMSPFIYWNQKALRLLLEKVTQLMRENPDHNLIELKKYLSSKRERTNYGETLFWLIVMVVISCCVIGIKILNSDSYVINHSPKAEEVCQIVEERYGIELEEEDIKIRYVKNSDLETKIKNPKVVKYDIVYGDGEEAYSFTGIYLPKEKSGPVFDLEKEIMEKYIEEYLNCEYFPNWKVMAMDGFRIQPEISSEEDRDVFVEQFSIMMDDLFHDPMMKNSDFEFQFDIGQEGALLTDSVYISMNKEDYVEKCALLSEQYGMGKEE